MHGRPRLPRRIEERTPNTLYRRDRYLKDPDGGGSMMLDRQLVYWNGVRLLCPHKSRIDRCNICLSGKCKHGSDDPDRCVQCVVRKKGACPHQKKNGTIGGCRQCLETFHCPKHDLRIADCKPCTKVLRICSEHGLVRAQCRACRSSQGRRCACGKRLAFCKTCPGGGRVFCEHGKQLAFCAECPGGGSALCSHKRQRFHCAQCRREGDAKAVTLYCKQHNVRRDRCIQCLTSRKEHARALFDAYQSEEG